MAQLNELRLKNVEKEASQITFLANMFIKDLEYYPPCYFWSISHTVLTKHIVMCT